MQIRVLASTKPGYEMPKEEAMIFSGTSAGICYMPNTMDDLLAQSDEKKMKRANGTLNSGHHSVFGHPYYNLIIEDAPKIIAMILNNEKMYNTSEKSARYTTMKVIDPLERELYEKWIEIFKQVISQDYSSFDEKYVEKLAKENARYLISVFTPATTMEYTVSFQQLNYIIYWAKKYILESGTDTDPFKRKLRIALIDFVDALPNLEVKGLDTETKGRGFSLFATRPRNEEFGENYSTNYTATFAQLAQAQRHRTLSYEMTIMSETNFYIPTIIRDSKYYTEWLDDITSLKDNYPQGMLVNVNERGTIENFVLKCTERLCGCAQLEIMQQTKITLDKYVKAVSENQVLSEYLLPYTKGPRCTFPNWRCEKPCVFGPKGAFSRTI